MFEKGGPSTASSAELHVEDKVQTPSAEEIEQTAKLIKQALTSPRQAGIVSKAYESVMKLLEKSASPMDTMKMILNSKEFAELNIDKSPELKAAFQEFMKTIDMKEEDILKELQFQLEHSNGFKGRFFVKLRDYLQKYPSSSLNHAIGQVLHRYDNFHNQTSITIALEAVFREKIASIIGDERTIFDYIDFSKLFPNNEDLDKEIRALTAKIRSILNEALNEMMDSILDSSIEVDTSQKLQPSGEAKPQLPTGEALEQALLRFLSSAPASADKLKNAVYQALLTSLEENGASTVSLQKLLEALYPAGTGPAKEGSPAQGEAPEAAVPKAELQGNPVQAQAAKKLDEALLQLAKQGAELPASPSSSERRAFFSQLEAVLFPATANLPQTSQTEAPELPPKAIGAAAEVSEPQQKAFGANTEALEPQAKQALFSQLETLAREELKSLVYQLAREGQKTPQGGPTTFPSAAQDAHTAPTDIDFNGKSMDISDDLAKEASQAVSQEQSPSREADSSAMRRLVELLEQSQSTLRLSLMKSELLPKLAQLKTPETEQDITLFTQNLVRAYDGLPQNFLKSVESLFAHLRQIHGLEEEQLLPLRFSLLETLRDAAAEKSGLTETLAKFLNTGAKESGSEAGKSVFQNLLRSLVLKNSAGLPADHFFLPIHYGNVYLLSELWKTQKKEICMEEDENGNAIEAPHTIYKLFLAFDIENLGYFETSIFYDERAFSIELSLPDSLRSEHGDITDRIRGIIERNHMTVSSMYFRSSNPRRKPDEIMKLLQ